MRTISLRISLLVLGLSGIIAQITLLRELLVSFLGNELTLGVILANWLISEAIGSLWIGRLFERGRRSLEGFVLFQLIFSLALPTAIYLSRTFKNVLVVTPGETLGFAPILYASLLILFPVALSHGALFTIACQLYAQAIDETASSIGKVYVFETWGTLFGGLIMSFLLIPYLHGFTIAFIVSLVNTLICLLLLSAGREPERSSDRKVLQGFSLLFSIFFLFLLAPPVCERIHFVSLQSQWRGLHVIHNENSIYGNVTVTQRGEQLTFFTDGIPAITTPYPDLASIEDFVHFPMLFHQAPETVLVVSGGAGGTIHEILKYPVRRVDYVELDPLILRLVEKFPTPLTRSELSDPRVRIHYADGRYFVRGTGISYDIILIGLSAPHELQTNRLFTTEFFSLAKRKMTDHGIIVLTLPGSLTYLSPELRDLNRCLLESLKRVFDHVRVVPGEVNLYLASTSEKLEQITPKEMADRLHDRKVSTRLFNRGYIEHRLQERWSKWFGQAIEAGKTEINSDFRPLGVFYHLSHWNALFSPFLAEIFRGFEEFGPPLGLLLIALITLAMGLLFWFKPHRSGFSVPYSIFMTGLSGMMFELAIIFTFQTLYGYLYYQIGLLITVFMMGAGLGGFWVTRHLDRLRRREELFLITELSILIFAMLLPLLFFALSPHMEKPFVYLFLYALFLITSFISGGLIGVEFPLAAKIYHSIQAERQRVGKTAGLLYGADLLGGFFGGFLGGVLLLPVLGLKESCLLVALTKLSSGLLFFQFTKIKSQRIL